MLASFLVRWLGNGLGLWIAARLVAGVSISGGVWTIVMAALVFSIVNAFIKPILIVLSLPAVILSLGLFILIINSFLLYLVTAIYPPFQVATFTAALLTVIIVWLVNYAVSVVLDKKEA